MHLRLSAPTEDSAAGTAARRLARLVGTAVRAANATVGALLYLGLGDGLASAEATLERALRDAFADTAVDTLGAWETALGLPVRDNVSIEVRRRDLVAKLRAAISGTATNILRTVRVYAAEAQIVAVGASMVAGTDPRAVFRFVLLLSETHWNDTALRAQLDQLLAQQVTSHVGWIHTVGAGPDLDPFRCDDPDSLCDRDVLAL